MAEIKVMLSAAYKEAYVELVPQFERASGHKVTTIWARSVDVVSRIRDGEIVDLAIIPANSIDELIKLGKIAVRFDLMKSGIGVAVRAGARRPDISSGEALKREVLKARSVVYSTGPSGVYLADLFQRMGIADAMQAKTRIVLGEPAGAVVARGEAEIGFQQVGELLPVPGIDLIGPLPPDIQHITVFSAGLHVSAREPEAARALVKLFTSAAAVPLLKQKGMEPV